MNHCNTTIKKRKLVVWWLVKRQYISYRDGRTQEFSIILFCSLPFGLSFPIRGFRTLALNIKELPEMHLYTFWVENLTPDIPLFTNLWARTYIFFNVCLISTIHLNSPFPLVSFIPYMGVASLKRSMGKGFWSPYLTPEMFVKWARGSVTDG